ncbi:hypothetical protein COOONC_26493 [Cooperia oncophora]
MPSTCSIMISGRLQLVLVLAFVITALAATTKKPVRSSMGGKMTCPSKGNTGFLESGNCQTNYQNVDEHSCRM